MQAQTTASVKNYLNREQLNEKAANCTLFITVAPQGIILLAADMIQKEVMGLKAIDTGSFKTAEATAKQLTEWIEQGEFAGVDFQQRVVLIENSCYTIIPEALFIAEKAGSYLKLVHRVGGSHEILYNRTSNHVCIYAAPALLMQNLRHVLPGSLILHTAGVYVESIFNSISKSEKDLLHVNLHKQFMDVVHIRNGQLQFVNTFPFEADTDIVFFLLSVAEQQKMNNDKLAVLLSGEVSQSDALINMLKKYIPEVLLQTRPEEFIYPAAFREFQDQQYYQSLAALLCGL
jgi:hypothetical protein